MQRLKYELGPRNNTNNKVDLRKYQIKFLKLKKIQDLQVKNLMDALIVNSKQPKIL